MRRRLLLSTCRGNAAFTLLEVVVAMTLVSVLMVTTLGWIQRQAALSRVVSQRAEDVAMMEAVARLLRDDLLLAALDPKGGRCSVAAVHLQCRTLNQIPGEPAGYREVEWAHDPETGRLVRRSRGGDGRQVERLVTSRFRQFAFTGSGSAVALSIGDETRTLTIQVWSEPPPVAGE